MCPAVLSALGKTFSDPARTWCQRPRKSSNNPQWRSWPVGPTPPVSSAGTASLYADRLSDVREASWRVVRMGRDGGPVRQHLGGLMHLCLDDYLTGLWDEVAELADEGLQLCEDLRLHRFRLVLPVHPGHGRCRTWGRGHQRTALADRITHWAVSRGVRVAMHYADHCRVRDSVWDAVTSRARTSTRARSARQASSARMCRMRYG